MKNYLTAIILVGAGLAPAHFIPANITPADPVFDQLYTLEGHWIMKTKNGIIGEEWTKIDSDYLQSRGYMTKGIDTITTERVALRNTTEGIFYTSTVENQNNRQPIAFRLTSSDNNTFVFENPLHDYPKRISYRFINKDSLHAWIDNGKERTEEKSAFRYSRAK
ncbi:MAG: DUF6265 family protein [Ferruginibacter sp.]